MRRQRKLPERPQIGRLPTVSPETALNPLAIGPLRFSPCLGGLFWAIEVPRDASINIVNEKMGLRATFSMPVLQGTG
jgi:hypothetical protein